MTKINEENIRVAAYYIWEQAGRPEGKDAEFWFQACEQFLNATKKNEKAVKKTTKPAAKTSAKATEKASVKKVSAEKSVKKPVAAKTPFYGVKK